MKCIYMWKNNVNNKIYIGQTVNIEERKIWYQKELREKNTRPIIQGMLKHGFENFSLSIVEVVADEDMLSERELYWIKLLDAENPDKGYNFSKRGENNNRAVLTEELVLIAREKFHLEELSLHQILSLPKFSEIASESLRKAISGETWSFLPMPQKIRKNRTYSKGGSRAKLNKEDVLDIRKKHTEGITVSSLHRSYYPSVSRETIKRVVEYKTFKNL